MSLAKAATMVKQLRGRIFTRGQSSTVDWRSGNVATPISGFIRLVPQQRGQLLGQLP